MPVSPFRFPGTLVVIAKRPDPGRVKTRLMPALTADGAAALAAAALTDTLDVVDRTAPARRLLAFAGDPAGWHRPGWELVAQPEGGLDVRLAAAFAAAAPGPALVVGMDTPQLRPDLLSGFDPDRFDAALGPATDGGYWAIGLTDPARADAALLGVPMSTSRTGAVQHARLRDLGLRVQRLPELTDVDHVEDAVTVAAQAPGTRFAAAVAACGLSAVGAA